MNKQIFPIECSRATRSLKRKGSMPLPCGAHPVGPIHASFPNYYGRIIIRRMDGWMKKLG